MRKAVEFFPYLILYIVPIVAWLIWYKRLEKIKFGFNSEEGIFTQVKRLAVIERWAKTKPIKVLLYLGLPYVFTIVILEELIFRVPLMIMFDKIDSNTLIVISFASIIFGLCHFRLNEVIASIAETNRDLEPINRRMIRMSLATLMGFIVAILGVLSQSIALVIILHLFWNFILVPIVATLMAIVISKLSESFQF